MPIDQIGIEGLASSAQVPAGAVMNFAMSTPPSGWIKANGAAVSRTTYAALFAAIGTTFGAGDGSTTFNVPDLRGEFQRGWDDGRGVDTGRVFGSAQGDAIRNITGSVGIRAVGATPSGAFSSTSGGLYYVNGGSYGTLIPDFDASRQVPTAAENRPRNIALLTCIKT